jgi:hypothetical protein
MPEPELPLPPAAITPIKLAMEKLIAGDYEWLVEQKMFDPRAVETTREWLEDYGEKHIMPPPEYWDELDEIQIRGRREWFVDADLWTEAGENSDYTMQVRVIEEPDGTCSVFIEDVHVM